MSRIWMSEMYVNNHYLPSPSLCSIHSKEHMVKDTTFPTLKALSFS